MTKRAGFIDPPGEFAPAYEWRAFVAEMRALDPTPEARAAVEEGLAGLRRAEESGQEDGDDDFSDIA